MKKSLVVGLAALLVLGVIGAPVATAKKKKKKPIPATKTITFEAEGTIQVAGPSGVAFGITESEFYFVNNCAMPASQGLDGYVVEIPSEFQAGTASLQVAGSDATGAYDLDVYFYDSGCNLMEPYMTEGADPSGAIVTGAKWAVVNLSLGANASFKLTGTATVNGS